MTDFGLQLYIPWEICSGKVLIRDVTHLHGPFSQYWNAGLFKIFGISLTTLIVANLITVAGLATLIYAWFLKVSDAVTATAVCLLMLLVFTFCQYVNIGNYNYICPYSHELFHGLVLTVLITGFLSRWVTTKKRVWIAAAAFCLGLVAMTKPEVFFAAGLVTGAAVILFWRGTKQARLTVSFATALIVLGCFIAPLAVFFAGFCFAMPPGAALRAVLWPWALLATPVTQNDFYKRVLGFDDPLGNIQNAVVHFFVCMIAVMLCVRAAQWWSRGGMHRIFAMVVLAGIGVFAAFSEWLLGHVGLGACASYFDWFECGFSLPLLSLAICGSLLWHWWKRGEPEALVFPILWSVFGLFFLAKLGLHSRVYHYGFALAMPASLTCVYFLIWYLPQRIASSGFNRGFYRVSILILLAIGVGRLLLISNDAFKEKTFALGHDGDTILTLPSQPSPGGKQTSPHGKGLQLTIDWLEKNTVPGSTLAVLPEGVTLNYLARRPNPSPYTLFVPAEIKANGEENMLRSFERGRPDYIAIVHRDHSEYGIRFFGKDPGNGLSIMRWIEANYTPVYLIGREPLQDERFGIKILKRKAGSL